MHSALGTGQELGKKDDRNKWAQKKAFFLSLKRSFDFSSDWWWAISNAIGRAFLNRSVWISGFHENIAMFWKQVERGTSTYYRVHLFLGSTGHCRSISSKPIFFQLRIILVCSSKTFHMVMKHFKTAKCIFCMEKKFPHGTFKRTEANTLIGGFV